MFPNKTTDPLGFWDRLGMKKSDICASLEMLDTNYVHFKYKTNCYLMHYEKINTVYNVYMYI